MRRYNQKVRTYTHSDQHYLDECCNGYVAVNIGDTLASVNDIEIKPPVLPTVSGEGQGVLGSEGEIFSGTNGVIPIVFLGALGANPKVIIVEKYYID